MAKWQFWVDRGGTFTDLVARTPAGQFKTAKLLSHKPQQYPDAVLQGICQLMDAPSVDQIPSDQIDCVRLGTTVATNALLERKGAPTLLVTTRGFGDALQIGYQNRPDLFALHIELPRPLYREVIEIDERLAADGSVVVALDAQAHEQVLRGALARGIKSVAVVFMHAYCNPAHELAIGEVAKKVGFEHITLSHQASALIKFIGRGDTTVVDAYVAPVLQNYIQGLAERLPATRLLFMQSSGGLIEGDQFRGRNSLLSGPAGGMIGGVQTGIAEGFHEILGFDMGGTSTDVWHYNADIDVNADTNVDVKSSNGPHVGFNQDGDYRATVYERVYETTLAGNRLRVPMLDIHTVAAGGGSICTFDGNRLRVGPESAGAAPGPACYGGGGPLTITDCNLVLGKLQPDYFPRVFGQSGKETLDVATARAKLSEVVALLTRRTGQARSVEAVAEGFIAIAVTGMAGAIKKVSTERGRNVQDYVLACFGGAAGQHACLVAEQLGVQTVLIHPMAGVLSALGMGFAEINAATVRSLEWPLSGLDITAALTRVTGEMRAQALAQLSSSDQREPVRWQEIAYLRYRGSDSAIGVKLASIADMHATFERKHRARFSFLQTGKEIVIDSLSVEAILPGLILPDLTSADTGDTREHESEPLGWSEPDSVPHQDPHNVPTTSAVSLCTDRFFSRDVWQRSVIFDRKLLVPGERVVGPAIIVEDTATTVVEPGWRANVLASKALCISRLSASELGAGDIAQNFVPGERGARRAVSKALDPVHLELFNFGFMSIAEQMGAVLAQTAHSVNIKERLDFSCALFDGTGALVANAPHVPVHLGSMGETVVQMIVEPSLKFQPGDAYLTNSPFAGGTHLPDLTVVTPVFAPGRKVADFFVATRAHHADIGGITPGSIPPDSRTIAEEGVLFRNFPLVKNGVFQESLLQLSLAGGPYPARNMGQNIADLQAQVAANVRGQNQLLAMISDYGGDVVTAYMGHVQDNAEQSVRRVIADLNGGSFRSVMDNGAEIAVAVRVDHQHGRLTVDFTGTSPQQLNNFNAPASVCRAAVLYVLRTLVAENIPLNAGCLKPVDLVIPEGSILNPVYPAAVVAGNVETSQYIADTLYGALAVLAGSQGTMNNLTFGNENYQYYETICGGAGAGDGFNGASAVQVHMTNSRLTDPEILELRFPVRLENFAIRTDSGGTGQYRGGNGVVRQLRFLQPMTGTVVSGHRSKPTFGLAGGGEGKVGVNYLIRAGERTEPLAGVASFAVNAGDRLVIETPGGGGYGVNH